ncbi:hypothetical protein E2C01_037761 [Portunus trituberculatus]|uniref:Uncharacterized protein n=1 Tax=Portunus trituberculatus TaxID=210409 RepID=A0A5B7FGN9_PORTR|nr:hypothetical protein [Portunus trituberculatus]
MASTEVEDSDSGAVLLPPRALIPGSLQQQQRREACHAPLCIIQHSPKPASFCAAQMWIPLGFISLRCSPWNISPLSLIRSTFPSQTSDVPLTSSFISLLSFLRPYPITPPRYRET